MLACKIPWALPRSMHEQETYYLLIASFSMRRHPFNVEPPLSTLLEHRFITPASLHYVRNHGPVPRIQWAQHRLAINGLVERPVVFTLDELIASFEHVHVLCTLTCAGNRRKVVPPGRISSISMMGTAHSYLTSFLSALG